MEFRLRVALGPRQAVADLRNTGADLRRLDHRRNLDALERRSVHRDHPDDTTNVFSAGAQRANVLRNPNLPNSEKSLDRWFDTSAFEAPEPFTFGNAGRGIVRADGRINFDFSLSKTFYVRENVSVQFRGETFNAFNHPDFGLPGRSLGGPGFGVISSATDARVTQLGLRIGF
jgi:hypothetical protein